MSLNEGILSFLGIALTFLSAWVVAKFTRNSSREANQTTGWTNLVSALQKDVERLDKKEDETRKQIEELEKQNRVCERRIYDLERSRRLWKWWGRRVAEIMRDQGVQFPDPPEPLEDTDPNIRSV